MAQSPRNAAQDPARLFAEAEQAFARGDLATARQRLATVDRLAPGHPAVLHLAALVARKSGDAGAAEQLFVAAHNAAPRDAQVLNNHANFCGDQGRKADALALYDKALALRPDFTEAAFNRALTLTDLEQYTEARRAFAALEAKAGGQALFWSARGRMEREAGDPHQAAIWYDKALALDPGHARSLHGRARLALECGEGDTVARFAAIHARNPQDRLALLGEAQARHEANDPAGAAMVDALLAEQPDWLDAVLIRAEMRWEAGDTDHYLDDINRALDARPGDPLLLRARIDLCSGTDQFARAADFARDAQPLQPEFPEFLQLEAVNAGAMGDHGRAAIAIDRMHARGWHDAMVESRHWLRSGDPAQAEAVLAPLRAAEPGNIAAWAQSDFAWRMLGDKRHEWLHGQDNLYKLRPLGLADSDVSRIADYLRDLHNRSAFPVGQSLRGGTQTRGALLWRREPEAALLREAIYAGVLAHWQDLPARDDAHPLLRHRYRVPAFRGSWSVRLTDHGFHVAHIHPHGLLSSASYWVVPQAEPGGDPQSGHLEIGGPPADLDLPLGPRTIIAPKPGHLALFPSTLMHGTRPFAKGERITMAFDVVAH